MVKKRANATFKIISHWLDFFNSAGLNYQLLTDELLKFFAFHQFLGADIEDKGAIGSAKQAVDLVDTDVAVLGSFPYGQCNLQMDRHLIRCDHHSSSVQLQIGIIEPIGLEKGAVVEQKAATGILGNLLRCSSAVQDDL